MKKKSMYLITLLTASAILAGCGDTSSNTSIDEGNGDLSFNENGDVIFDNVELNLWSVTTGDDAKTQDQIIERFNCMYEGMIHVGTPTHVSRYDMESILTSTMQYDRKNAPDMLFTHGARTAEYQEKNWLLPIERYYEKGNLVLDKKDYSSSLLDAVTIGNEVYATPIDVHSAIVEIRVDILEKNNLKIPTNYQELVEVCDRAAELAAKNELYIRGTNSQGYKATEWRRASSSEPYAAFPISHGDMWVHEFAEYTAAIQNGGKLVDDRGMPAWNSDETVRGLQILRDWIFPSDTSLNRSPMSLDFGSTYDVGEAPFIDGTAIFKLNGPWVYASDVTTFDRDLKDDGGSDNITTRTMASLFAEDPSKDCASKVKGEGHALMLTSTVESTTKRVAAAVFADYMSYYSGIEWAKRGHIPAANSVVLSDDYTSDPAYESYIRHWGTPDDYIVYGTTQYYSYVDTYFKNAGQKALSVSYKNQDLKTILNKEYKDCVDYIELYA